MQSLQEAAVTQRQGNYKPAKGIYTLCRLYSCPVFLCRNGGIRAQNLIHHLTILHRENEIV